MPVNFRSDNEHPVAPEIMAALAAAGTGMAHAYGDDPWTARLEEQLARVFERELAVFPLVSGTAANALAVAQTTPSWGGVICHQDAHLHTDECGAPEFYASGVKLMPVAGEGGKLTAEAVEARIANAGHAGDHSNRPTLLSLTQATEFGTVYSADEVAALAGVAAASGLCVHMDGARFANALATTGCTPAELTWRAGVDLLSFGATKNGAMMAEALLVFDPAHAVELGRRRKQAGHLLSKMRYVSAQLEAYLTDDLWLRLAAQANDMARRLVAGLEGIAVIRPAFPVQSNEVFLHMTPDLAAALRDDGIEFHEWPGRPGLFRFVTGFSTTEQDVDTFLTAAAAHCGHEPLTV
jgi:threonine aldolase